MVALITQVIQSFKVLVSYLPAFSSFTTTVTPNAQQFGHPLPQVIHRSLSKEFIDSFNEVIVIGDIHGCYEEMIQLLDEISGNNNNSLSNDTNNNQKNENKRILKLFVGDLVNKGPNSPQVLDFMIENTDSCLSVRGNHDELVVREYLKYEKDGESALKEKNRWMKTLTRKQVDYLISLPFTISIPNLNALVVHAGVVPNVPIKDQNLMDLIEMRNIITDHKSGEMKATSKHNPGHPWTSVWLGPQHVYFGHDAKRKLQKREFATGLDTGCVYGGFLTAVFIHGPRKGHFVKVQSIRVHSRPQPESPELPDS